MAKANGSKINSSKAKKNADGEIDPTLQPDTLQITAYFNKADQAQAYFSLISYINYAVKELHFCNEKVNKAIKTQGTRNYIFPWRNIDDENITTLGFEKKQLQFNLDQENIMNLLVGHTLYNDTSVVLREIVQNSLDAIKLQRTIEKSKGQQQSVGRIEIHWDSRKRLLSFYDNGTGMNLYDIENYLFKVGASKYRTEQFRKDHPEFSAISRFGIGILTCFLVANDIDIYTCSPEEQQANFVALRNVNGKYLLKRIDKRKVDNYIRSHGTRIDLYVRPDVVMDKFEKELKKWIVVPACEVILIIDNGEKIIIGHKSIKDALKAQMANDTKCEVFEKTLNGVTLAYAARYSDYLEDWSFVRNNSGRNRSDLGIYLGTCINGIRVEFTTPGFKSSPILAMCNVSDSATTTNVSRNAVEYNQENDKLLITIYKLYAEHLQDQITKLCKNHSLSWAASEAFFLSEPLLPHNSKEWEPWSEHLLIDALGNINCLVVEKSGKRLLMSPNSLSNESETNIVVGNLIFNAEHLLREVGTEYSLSALITTITNDHSHKLSTMDNLLCNYSSINDLHTYAMMSKEVVEISVDRKYRSIYLKFKNSDQFWNKEKCFTNIEHSNYIKSLDFFIPSGNFDINGLNMDEIGVRTILGIYLRSDHFIVKYLKAKLLEFGESDTPLAFEAIGFLIDTIRTIIIYNYDGTQQTDNNNNFISNILLEKSPSRTYRRIDRNEIWSILDKTEFMSTVFKERFYFYDTSNWTRESVEK